MRRVNNFQLGLKHHILILTLLPLLFITTLLAIYFVVSRQADAQEELIRQVSSTLHYLSKSSELELFSGDEKTLLRLARTTRANNDIKSVSFFDFQKREIVTSGEQLDKSKLHFKSGFYKEEYGSQWLFQMPVYYSQIEVADFPTIEGKPESPKFLGWVHIIADKRRLQKKQRSILLAGVTISLLGFTLLALLALKFSHSITDPLDKITKTVQKLEAGDYSARVDIGRKAVATSELQGLLQGINRLSEKVEESNESLKKRVDIAVKKLTQTLNELEQKNNQLEKTQTELIDANKAKDDFLASVSHELRTPLTAILGYCHLLEKEKMLGKQVDYVEVIQKASTLLLSLIDNILNFSKLKTDSIELEHHPFNLELLLDEIMDLHLPDAQERGINLRITVDLDVPLELVGDELRIKQIINNLMRNAIKFTHQGLVSLRVSLLEKNARDFGLLFTIKDTGIGMDLSESPDLFQSFCQADPSISRRFGGTGLGLMICKKLVDLFDGEIRLSSKKGEGTEVVFSLLNINKQTASDQLVKQDAHQIVQDSTMLSGITVLIVEDNLFVKRLLETILRSNGANIISVDNGLDAIEKSLENTLDLVLLDYNMPILNGLQTCKLIRQSFTSTELPIFFITADILSIDKLDLSDIGVNKIIHKPINELELLQSIYRYTLADKSTTGELPETSDIKPRVFDYLPDGVVLKEIRRLSELLQKAFANNDNAKMKNYAHQICGLAGPASQYQQIELLARQVETAIMGGRNSLLVKLMLKWKMLMERYE